MAANPEPELEPIHPESGRRESDADRVDRNLTEFLGELRVALPGVQVLFAFLLVVPFNSQFDSVTGFQRGVYFATLLSAAMASICLIAPTVQHRIEFRRHLDKEGMLMASNRLAIAGLGFLALAIAGAVLLVTDYLYGGVATAFAFGAVVLAIAIVWFGIPIWHVRQRSGGGEGDEGGSAR